MSHTHTRTTRIEFTGRNHITHSIVASRSWRGNEGGILVEAGDGSFAVGAIDWLSRLNTRYFVLIRDCLSVSERKVDWLWALESSSPDTRHALSPNPAWLFVNIIRQFEAIWILKNTTCSIRTVLNKTQKIVPNNSINQVKPNRIYPSK